MLQDKKEDNKNDKEEKPFSKKTGFDMREHITMRIDALEAEAYRAKKEKIKLRPKEKNLPLGIQKIRKKIREIYDEEDDDDYDYTFIKIPQLQEDNFDDHRLLDSLSESEKRMLKQKDTIENMRQQQDAGKMEALQLAHQLAKEAGLQGLNKKETAKEMQQAVFDPQKAQKKLIKKEVSQKLGIRGDIEKGKIIQAARGIKKIEQLGGKGAVKNLDMKDIIKAGEEKLDEIKLAELILEKSGQDIKKRKQKVDKSKENLQLKNFENNKSDSSKPLTKDMLLKQEEFVR